MINEDVDAARRWAAQIKLLRALCALVNVVCWSVYANAVRNSVLAAGYGPNAVMVTGMAVGAIAGLGWLHSIRAGVVVQVIVTIVIIIFKVFGS